MVTILDVFAQIAKDLHRYSGEDDLAAVDEFLDGSTFDFDLAITPDVAITEFNFVRAFGVGYSYSFELDSYSQGRSMMEDMYWVIRGRYPDMASFTGEYFLNSDKLHLFVHIRNLSPVPVISTAPAMSHHNSIAPASPSRGSVH